MVKDQLSEPKSITASQRVKESPEECLEATGAGKSKLFLAASEHVFSLLTNSFAWGKVKCFPPRLYIEASIMMQYNNRDKT